MPGPGSDISVDIPAKEGADSPYGDTEGLCVEYEDIGGFTPGVIPGGGLYTGPGGLGGGGGSREQGLTRAEREEVCVDVKCADFV